MTPLAHDDGTPGWLASVDATQGTVLMVPVPSAPDPQGRVPELWLIPAGQAPRSLGAVSINSSHTVTVPQDVRAASGGRFGARDHAGGRPRAFRMPPPAGPSLPRAPSGRLHPDSIIFRISCCGPHFRRYEWHSPRPPRATRPPSCPRSTASGWCWYPWHAGSTREPSAQLRATATGSTGCARRRSSRCTWPAWRCSGSASPGWPWKSPAACTCCACSRSPVSITATSRTARSVPPAPCSSRSPASAPRACSAVRCGGRPTTAITTSMPIPTRIRIRRRCTASCGATWDGS